MTDQRLDSAVRESPLPEQGSAKLHVGNAGVEMVGALGLTACGGSSSPSA